MMSTDIKSQLLYKEINVKNYLFPFTGGSHLQINTTVIVNEIKEVESN